ncbi:MAG: ribbon-helix-helix domain-containing protein [Desulfobacterales bacterium]
MSRFLIDKKRGFNYPFLMKKIPYNTRVDEDLIKKFKVLAIMENKRQNDLFEEAIRDLLEKYEKKDQK